MATFEISHDSNEHSGQQSPVQPGRTTNPAFKETELDENAAASADKNKWYNVRLDVVRLVKKKDFEDTQQPYAKLNKKIINTLLRLQKVSPMLILFHDILLFIYFCSTFIYSIVQFIVNQDPLVYNIVCHIASFNGLVVQSFTFAYMCYKYKKNRACRVKPETHLDDEKDKKTKKNAWDGTMEIEDIEKEDENQLPKLLVQAVELDNKLNIDIEELLDKSAIKSITLAILKYIFIVYPSVICSLYGFVNGRSWRFNDTFAGIDNIIILYAFYINTVETNFRYIGIMQQCIASLTSNDSNDDCTTKLKKCWLTSLLFTPQYFILTLIQWIMLCIIGVRIYVDNFSREVAQGDTSETGGYEVTGYTGYMIACGVFLPIASAFVFLLLNRAWLSDEINTVQKIFYFLGDPISYIAAVFLMGFFIAFCVGIYLPDYDSSEFEVDSNARNATGNLGIVFIAIFLLFNIQAAVIFAIVIIIVILIVIIIVVIIVVIILIIILKILDCLSGGDTHDETKHTYTERNQEEERKQEELKQEERKREELKQEELKQEERKREELKPEELKQEEHKP